MKTIFANRACGILYRFVKQYPGRYLLPANVCPVVPLTLKLAGADLEFVDIDSETLCIDEQRCSELVKLGKTQGVVFVHTYGTSYNPQTFFKKLKKHASDIRIVDDKCLCIPDFTLPNTVADLTLFSTGYAKYVDLGGGGFGFLQKGFDLSTDQLMYEGTDIEPFYKEAFAKSEKISDLPKGWLDARVSEGEKAGYRQKVEESVEMMKIHKKAINDIYSKMKGDFETLSDDFNQWRYNILVKDKTSVKERLFAAGLFASSHYQPSSVLFVDALFPHAQSLYDRVVNLFNDKYFSQAQAKEVVKLMSC